jgi:hypothetical protein
VSFKRIFILVSLLFAVASTIFLNSCSAIGGAGSDEGVIQFDTKAIDKNHPLYDLAPNSAHLHFKGDKFLIEMSTMGLFNMSIIGDNLSKSMTQMIKFMDLRQACIETEAQLRAENDSYKLTFEETSDTKEIAGYTCKRIIAKKVNSSEPPFDVWYTEDLGKSNCNLLTPYAEIKGLLMDYKIKKFGMEMQFTAVKYTDTKIDDQLFKVPSDIKIVDQKEMQKFFDELEE